MLAYSQKPLQKEGAESRLYLMTPPDARRWRETKQFPRQRAISPTNVKRLALEMKQSRFIPGLQIYICVLFTGEEVIVNGNHTLEAIVESGVPQTVTITKWPVANLDEAAQIYAVFDQQKNRNWNDTLKALGKDAVALEPTRVMAALKYVANSFGQVSTYVFNTPRMEAVAMLEDYEQPVAVLQQITVQSPKETQKFVKRASIMAVALETIRWQPSFAAEFWRRVVRDDGLTHGSPERALLRYLRNVPLSASGEYIRAEQARAAALAWNAAFRQEPREVLKPNAMTTFVLLGTTSRLERGIEIKNKPKSRPESR